MVLASYSGSTDQRENLMDVRTLMRRSVETWGAHEAIVAGSTRLTFEEAWDRGLRLANVLLERGLVAGDRVAVIEDNSLEASDFFLATTAANLVRVPLYPRNSREAHHHMISHTGCRAVVAAEQHHHEVVGLDDEIPAVETILVRDGSYEALLAGASAVDPNPTIGPDDTYIIRHTGGTTGLSKGVPYTHRQWLAAGRDWFYPFPPVEIGDACLHVGPISHGSGYLFMPVWISGGKNVLLEKFEPEQTLDLMEAEKIAYMFNVPTILSHLVRHPSAAGRDYSRLKTINVGGSPITEATARLAREVFGDVLWQAYGQTEALPLTMVGPHEWFADIEGSQPLRSAGRALPFAELRILDVETLEPLPVGAEGVIAACCDGQMSAFWDDPEASAERIVDGFVITGDVGRLDANGYLYVLDRAGDMIISGGYNIYPAELENAISEHPAVIEAAVFAIPHERWGETPAAVCVVADISAVDEAAIIELVRERLGSYKKPSKVVITTDPLPKSPVGKVLRKKLREPFWEGQERRVAGS